MSLHKRKNVSFVSITKRIGSHIKAIKVIRCFICHPDPCLQIQKWDPSGQSGGV